MGLVAKVLLAESALGALTTRLTSLEQQAAALGAAQGAGSAPPPGLPPPEAGERLTEQWDRFTGERKFTLLPRHVVAKHRTHVASWAILQLAWATQADEGRVPVHVLQVRSVDSSRRWTDATRVYVLADGKRSSFDGTTKLDGAAAEGLERVEVVLDAPAATALAQSKVVELRVGDWELAAPAEFLTDVTTLLQRAAAPPPPK